MKTTRKHELAGTAVGIGGGPWWVQWSGLAAGPGGCSGRGRYGDRDARWSDGWNEAEALERILSGCTSTAMQPKVCMRTSTSASDDRLDSCAGSEALARYDDNRNGRITCKEARRHGIAPVHRSHPAYR